VADSETRRLAPQGGPPRSGPLRLLVLGEERFSTHALPADGRVILGRGEGADIRIEDSAISRAHAALVLGEGRPLQIEDLGSANGTRVKGQPLHAGEVRALAAGDTVELGETLLLVQRESPGRGRPEEVGAAVVVNDAAMQKLHGLLDRVARSTLHVLILGETGVGKEVLAGELHRRSPRADRPFLRLNCAAISESLLESELFGYEKGAFTGAVTAKPGLLETASGGTVLIDEVGELSLPLQVKLLRVLEERQVLPVGGLRPRPIDARFLFATNRDLETEVAEGRFRQDLYFRLNGISLAIPPLRERLTELEPLASLFAAEAATREGRTRAPAFSEEALRLLRGHSWPGNIRELKNAVERALLLCQGETLLPEHFPEAKLRLGPPRPQPDAEGEAVEVPKPSLRSEVAAAERRAIEDALESCAGNQTRAAKVLGISRRTLISRLQAYGLSRPRPRKAPRD
jgi:two-component system, NtrC family, response regulator AtoC